MSVVSKGKAVWCGPYLALYTQTAACAGNGGGAQLQLSCQQQLVGSAAVVGHLHLHSMMV